MNMLWNMSDEEIALVVGNTLTALEHYHHQYGAMQGFTSLFLLGATPDELSEFWSAFTIYHYCTGPAWPTRALHSVGAD